MIVAHCVMSGPFQKCCVSILFHTKCYGMCTICFQELRHFASVLRHLGEIMTLQYTIETTHRVRSMLLFTAKVRSGTLVLRSIYFWTVSASLTLASTGEPTLEVARLCTVMVTNLCQCSLSQKTFMSKHWCAGWSGDTLSQASIGPFFSWCVSHRLSCAFMPRDKWNIATANTLYKYSPRL